MIHSVVEELCYLYPELNPGSDEKIDILKRELAYFLISTEKEKTDFINDLAGIPLRFKNLVDM